MTLIIPNILMAPDIFRENVVFAPMLYSLKKLAFENIVTIFSTFTTKRQKHPLTIIHGIL
ncbi:MAG: hypothetical protein DRJ35_05740 [Thermoprotei archaeon]|nr:MAG: hypothetical protein DRJ35_05740 [Thermoprotei archaeon]